MDSEKKPARSKAWAALEKKVAEKLRAWGFTRTKRKSRGADFSESDFEVVVPEVPQLVVDTKYTQRGFHHHTLFEEVDSKYCTKNGKWAVMPTRVANSDTILVTLRLERFLDLLRVVYQKKDKSSEGWSCPRCPGLLHAKGLHMGLFQYECERCSLHLQTTEHDGVAFTSIKKEPALPSDASDVRLQRTKVKAGGK